MRHLKNFFCTTIVILFSFLTPGLASAIITDYPYSISGIVAKQSQDIFCGIDMIVHGIGELKSTHKEVPSMTTKPWHKFYDYNVSSSIRM